MSFIITKTTTLKILFSILSNFKALLFKKLLISLLISSFNIIGLILNALYSIIASILILLKFAILVFGKNLAIKISIFIILLLVKESLIDLLRSSK